MLDLLLVVLDIVMFYCFCTDILFYLVIHSFILWNVLILLACWELLSDMSSHVFPIFHTVLVMFLINSQLRHLICTYCFGFLLKPLCHLPWSYCFYLFILFFCSFQMCLLVDLCDTGWGKQKPLSCSNKFSLSCPVCSRQEWWNKRWTSPVKY